MSTLIFLKLLFCTLLFGYVPPPKINVDLNNPTGKTNHANVKCYTKFSDKPEHLYIVIEIDEKADVAGVTAQINDLEGKFLCHTSVEKSEKREGANIYHLLISEKYLDSVIFSLFLQDERYTLITKGFKAAIEKRQVKPVK